MKGNREGRTKREKRETGNKSGGFRPLSREIVYGEFSLLGRQTFIPVSPSLDKDRSTCYEQISERLPVATELQAGVLYSMEKRSV